MKNTSYELVRVDVDIVSPDTVVRVNRDSSSGLHYLSGNINMFSYASSVPSKWAMSDFSIYETVMLEEFVGELVNNEWIVGDIEKGYDGTQSLVWSCWRIGLTFHFPPRSYLRMLTEDLGSYIDVLLPVNIIKLVNLNSIMSRVGSSDIQFTIPTLWEIQGYHGYDWRGGFEVDTNIALVGTVVYPESLSEQQCYLNGVL